jgi:hypothetical protein
MFRNRGFKGAYVLHLALKLFKKLQSGDIEWSGAIREYIKEQEVVGRCIYCGSTKDLSVDHLIPRARGGPESGDNAVTACKACNSSRGDKGIYEWFELSGRNEVPRIVEGKYLKELSFQILSQVVCAGYLRHNGPLGIRR